MNVILGGGSEGGGRAKGSRAIQPQEWGHSGWSLLHRLSFCFRNATDAKAFYRTLEDILPCPKCRMNMREHSRIIPYPKKASLFPEWVWKLHNRVNESLGTTTPHNPVTLADVRNMYKDHCHTAKDCEAPFLLAIAETHPGTAKITPEYAHSLKTFIEMYTEKKAHIPDSVIMSRKAFRTWIQKRTNSKIIFKQCI